MVHCFTVVTIDLEDFNRLGLREKTHPGILVIPSGGTRKEQLNWVMTGWASNGGTFANPSVAVSFTGEIEVAECTIAQSNQPAPCYWIGMPRSWHLARTSPVEY
jgi:hypothetical protein